MNLKQLFQREINTDCMCIHSLQPVVCGSTICRQDQFETRHIAAMFQIFLVLSLKTTSPS